MAEGRRLLEVIDLRVYFESDEGVARAVDGVSFHLDEGETLAVDLPKRIMAARVEIYARARTLAMVVDARQSSSGSGAPPSSSRKITAHDKTCGGCRVADTQYAGAKSVPQRVRKRR